MLGRMSVSLSPAAPAVPASTARVAATDAMWPLWFALGSSLAAAFGTHWDIAWHRSIGRDSFWTPPHVAIYAAAVMAAVAALARILPATFGGASPRRPRVRVLGFRGPLGAFISAWGGGAMLASAPFDDWWHNAYGLDVKILSPPHVVLALGIIALHVGALVMIAGALNRADGARRRTLELLVIVVGGNLVVGLLTLFMEKTVRPFMHLGSFYLIVGLAVVPVAGGGAGGDWPPLGGDVGRASSIRCSCWRCSGRFRWCPRNRSWGPVLVPVTSLVPPEFPLLLLPAAVALDAWSWRRRGRPGAATVVIGALLFLGVFLLCQWPFASFLMSPPARNFFWGARYFDFWLPASTAYRRYAFLHESASATATLAGGGAGDARRWRWRRGGASAAGWPGCGDEARGAAIATGLVLLAAAARRRTSAASTPSRTGWPARITCWSRFDRRTSSRESPASTCARSTATFATFAWFRCPWPGRAPLHRRSPTWRSPAPTTRSSTAARCG